MSLAGPVKAISRSCEIVATRDVPAPHQRTTPLGRHLDGCRIGFDIGGSDRKVAAVIDEKVVFSDETTWDPYPQPDPGYHQRGIMDSLRKAAAHLPRVDAIGGSAAGVYVNNEVRVASLFRGVPPDVFDRRVKRMFFEIKKAWHDVPFEVLGLARFRERSGSSNPRSVDLPTCRGPSRSRLFLPVANRRSTTRSHTWVL